MITAGINEHGLTCDMQTLITTKMPAASNTSADLFVELFCQWALGGFADTDSVRAALLNASAVHVFGSELESGSNGQHYSLRDANGRSLVVEWVGGTQQVYQDLDDHGKTGWGIMTNEPEYPYMVRMVQHFEWKQSLARPSTSLAPLAWNSASQSSFGTTCAVSGSMSLAPVSSLSSHAGASGENGAFAGLFEGGQPRRPSSPVTESVLILR